MRLYELLIGEQGLCIDPRPIRERILDRIAEYASRISPPYSQRCETFGERLVEWLGEMPPLRLK